MITEDDFGRKPHTGDPRALSDEGEVSAVAKPECRVLFYRHLRVVCFIWLVFLVLDFLMAYSCIGFFTNGMTLLCHVSYLFGLGYFISDHVGVGYVGPMPISDWRWIVGCALTLAVSMSPALVRSTKSRVACYVLFVTVLILSLMSLSRNMVGALT